MKNRRLATVMVVLVVMLAVMVASVAAVTDGELDGDGHPYVGLMVAKNAEGAPLWRCSGALLSSTLFLTAGHCTESPAASAEIWFISDLEPDPTVYGYPFEGQASGETFTHPDYDPNAFYLFDLGVVVLDEPYEVDEYAELPQEGELNRMARRRGLQDVTFTAVGYGLQRINPVFIEQDLTRMYAEPHLIQINNGIVGDYSIMLSNNHATGGTCFGDSGGPNLIGTSNVVGGVTSFGLNGNCAGTGGVYRVDQPDDLNWLYGEFGDHLP